MNPWSTSDRRQLQSHKKKRSIYSHQVILRLTVVSVSLLSLLLTIKDLYIGLLLIDKESNIRLIYECQCDMSVSVMKD